MAPMKGMFKVKNPGKYKGDPTKVTYRSSWEFKCMMSFDHDPNVIAWNSECIAIAYLSPLDNRVHRYFPDFWVKENVNGRIVEKIIEVKPFFETQKPKMPPKNPNAKGGRAKNTRYIKEAMTYGVNMAKWAAAQKYCDYRGIQFVKLTENELFGKNGGRKV
jgi:hypothetical protein